MSADDNQEFVAYAYGSSSEPDIVPAERSREWMIKTGRSFANRCLPLLMANESGWWLRNQRAFTATWNGGPQRSDIDIAFDDGASPEAQPTSLFGYGILTWAISCVFRTPPDVELLVRGPANLPKDGITALEGLVETDWLQMPFTMNWKLTHPGLAVRFERDEPFAMLVPQGRHDLELYRPVVRPLSDAPKILESVHRWTDRSRRQLVRMFVAEHVSEVSGAEWDGAYMRGEHLDGSRFEDHRLRRELKPFTRPSD